MSRRSGTSVRCSTSTLGPRACRGELRRGLYDLFRDLYNDAAFARRQRQYIDLIHKLRRRENGDVSSG